mgnify:CR=1 FL=1
MQNTYGRAAVAGVAAVLALTLWRSGALQQIIQYGAGRENVLETDQSQLWEPGQNDPAPEDTPQYRPIEDDRPQPHRNSWGDPCRQNRTAVMPAKAPLCSTSCSRM